MGELGGWIAVIVAIVGLVALIAAVAYVLFTAQVMHRYGHHIVQIFEHKPLLVAQPPSPDPSGESVTFTTAGGRELRGSYLAHRGGARRGVILFCHEFSGNRWLCLPYADYLRGAGFDVFAFDFCNHGESAVIPGYQPLQWITTNEVADVTAALAYLKGRPDAPRAGLGILGVSKGAGAALAAAVGDRSIRAIVTDGAYPNHGTVVHYELRWVGIFTQRRIVYENMPRFFYATLCELTLRKLQRKHKVVYVRLERAIRKLGKVPLLMIRGARDNYINAPIVERFFALAAGGPAARELWTVEGAKHNRCREKAGAEYERRVTSFFTRHLAGISMDETEPAVEQPLPAVT